MTRQNFFNLLFEPNERTCFGAQPTDTIVSSLEQVPANAVFFCINPLHPTKDFAATESWHNADNPRRADANVTVFRNILIELDSVPIREQIQLVTSKIPVSSIVFSGNKSYHFIISLDEPCKNVAEYRALVRGIMEQIPQADKTTKNPSRFSRLPGVLRPDTKLYQELVYLGNRISKKELPEPIAYREAESSVEKSKLYVSSQLLAALDAGVDNYIEQKFSGRNQFFYWLGKRCSELKLTREEKKKRVDYFYERLQNKKGFSKVEAYHAARVKY